MTKYRVINDLDRGIESKARLPLLMVKGGIVYEADSIRGLICVLSSDYIDAEDCIDDWHVRVLIARRESMHLIASNINAIVYDSKIGIVKNNYAAAEDDHDYYNDFENDQIFKIQVDNEKEFIKSLIKIGSLKVFQREDCDILGEEKISCNRCSYNMSGICSLYKSEVDKKFTWNCGTEGNINEYEGGSYIEVIVS